MGNFVDLLVSKLKEPSTWHGLNVIVAALGFNLAPDLWQNITTIAVGIAGVVEVVRKD